MSGVKGKTGCWKRTIEARINLSNAMLKEKPSYTALHHWIEKWKGKPKFCSFCKTRKAKRFEWANISRLYKRDLSDFIRLCRKCHFKYDHAKT